MKFIISLVFLFLFGCCFSEEPPKANFIEADLNDYIDHITPFMVDFLVANGFDPMPLPDLSEGFSAKPILITYHGELELTKGEMTGLQTLKRSGDFKVAYLNKLLKIKGDFAFTNIGFTYDYLCKIMNIGPTGGVIGKVTKISGVMEMLIDFNNLELHLQQFDLYDVGKITIKLTGNVLIDWLSSAVINVITGLFKNVIIKIVEANLRKALQDYIDMINNSIGGISKLMEDAHNAKLIQDPVQRQSMEANPIFKAIAMNMDKMPKRVVFGF